mgnify:FL=1
MSRHLKTKSYLFILVLIYITPLFLLIGQEKENADFKLAVGLYNDGMYDLAAQQLKNFIETYPNTSNSIEARYYLGMTQMQLKRYDEARITFQNFALSYVEHPRAPEAWLKVGDAFLALNNYAEAASAYERVKVFHPKSQLVPQALLSAGKLYRQMNDRESAKKNFRLIIQDYPNDPHTLQARLAISELYADEGQVELAEREAKRVAESDAQPAIKAGALFSLGKLQTNLCLYTDAESTFNKIIISYKNTPAYPSACYELGLLSMAEGNNTRALEHLKRALNDKNTSQPLLQEILYAMGTVYNRMGNFTEAYNTFLKLSRNGTESGNKKAVRKEEETENIGQRALIEAGIAAYKASDYKNAIKIATEILKDENHIYRANALALAAEAMISTYRPADAVKYYSRLLTEFRDTTFTPLVAIKLAKIYEDKLKDYNKAILTYNFIAENYPLTQNAVTASIGIARCQELLGNYDECTSTYQSIQNKYPANSEYEAIEREIEYLKNHKIKNRDAGMEKLARLMSEMLEGKPKSEISYKLGEIYFNDLKDYEEAARQFSNIISENTTEERKAGAKYWIARSYHMLSETDSEYVASALSAYLDFIQKYPNSPYVEEAEYYKFQLQSEGNSPEDNIVSADNLLKKYPASKYRDKILYNLSRNYLLLGDTTKSLLSLEELIKKTREESILQKGYLLKGIIYKSKNQKDSALTNWKQVLKITLKTNAYLDALWNIADQEGNYNQAITYWKKIIEEYPYTNLAQKALENLPSAYMAIGEYDEALQIYTSKLYQESDIFLHAKNIPEIDYFIGTIYEKSGKREEALRYFRNYLLNNRTGNYASRAFYTLGAIAKAEGRIKHASSYFKLAGSTGEHKSTSGEIADILFKTEQYADAAKHYKLLAQSSTVQDSIVTYTSRAIVALMRSGNVSESEKMINEFKKSFPRSKSYDAEFTYEKALISYRNQDYTTAKKLFTTVTSDYDKTRFSPWANYYLAKISEQMNKPEEAAKKYESLLKNSPDSDVIPRVLLSLGNMHFNAERYEDAIRYYQQIVKSPERAGDILSYAMNNLIEAYSSVKLYDEALKVTREFIDRFPNDENLIDKKILLGTIYTKLGYYDQAILHLQNLIAEAGSLLEAELRYNIGEAYYYKGDYQQAILEFLKVPYVVSKQGKVNWTATALYMAGQSYEKISKFDEAIGMYQQIIDRPGIDATFKSAARKEIDRVNSIIKKGR